MTMQFAMKTGLDRNVLVQRLRDLLNTHLMHK
jgi:hypothetical protein